MLGAAGVPLAMGTKAFASEPPAEPREPESLVATLAPHYMTWLEGDTGAPVQLILLYEATGILAPSREGFFDFDDPENHRQFVDDMAYLERTYWSNPRYAHRFFRLDGRPALFTWNSLNFMGAWPAAVASARQEAAFYLVGSEFGIDLWPDGRPRVRSNLAEVVAPLDAVSSYGICDPRFVPDSGRLDATYAGRYERALRGWAELLLTVAPHARFIPPLQFAFDDHYARPKARHPPLGSSGQEAIAVARVARRLVDDARSGDPRYRNVLPVVFVVSWNEHIEGSAIEWTYEHPYGYLAAALSAFAA
jgi:hypothetical protein